VHQKLKISVVRVGCLYVGLLLNAIEKDFHAMYSHMFCIHSSLPLCSSSLGWWKMCAVFRVILDVTV
jgi:hypothetical protein